MRKYRPKKIVSLLLLISALCASFLDYNPIRQLDSNSISSSREIVPLDFTIKRKLVTNLGGGQCEWVDGVDVDQDPNFELFSTAIVAFPGAGKRIAFLQLEALTELTTRDDVSPPTNIDRYAFFKTQYPHHEGTWGWGAKCSQSIYLITDPKMALITYLFILHEINYAKTVSAAYDNLDRVFTLRSPIEDWEKWRDERVNAEIHWWSWHIEYWMEGGLLRDMFTHELTTSTHFDRIMAPTVYTEAELRNYQSLLINVQPEYDSHCRFDMESCTPVAIASYEKMMDPSTGPQEVAKFTSVIEGKAGITFVDQVARQCAWEQVVIKKASGRRDARDRTGPALQEYEFEPNQLSEMYSEMERIRDKFSAAPWSSNTVAQDLVGYMNEYIALYGVENIEEEVEWVKFWSTDPNEITAFINEHGPSDAHGVRGGVSFPNFHVWVRNDQTQRRYKFINGNWDLSAAIDGFYTSKAFIGFRTPPQPYAYWVEPESISDLPDDGYEYFYGQNMTEIELFINQMGPNTVHDITGGISYPNLHVWVKRDNNQSQNYRFVLGDWTHDEEFWRNRCLIGFKSPPQPYAYYIENYAY